MIRVDFEAWPELYEIRMKIKLMEFFPYNKELIRPVKKEFNGLLNEYFEDLTKGNFIEILNLMDRFRATIETFYKFIFTLNPDQKFEIIKTRGEKELLKLLLSERKQLTSRERIGIAKKLGEKISRRYFNHQASRELNRKKFLDYFYISLCGQMYFEFVPAVGKLLQVDAIKILAENERRIKKQKEGAGIFPGNSLFKRKDKGKLEKYIRVSKTIKILEDDYPFVSGPQKKVCEIIGVREKAFSKWKNNNIERVLEWQKNISEEERKMITSEIEKYLAKNKK